jgi:hypothetical protein
MRMKIQALLLAVTAAVFLAACASGPSLPEPGTPAFLWNEARHAYHSGDMPKANDYLSEIQQTDNSFTPRARIWQIVLAGGIARGYSDLADAYASGERLNHTDPLAFHRHVNELRASASHAAMDFTQAVHAFVARDPSTDVQLGFDLPPGSALEPVALRKPYGGTMPLEGEVLALQTAMLEHDVIGSICLANGSANDSAQMLSKFKAEVTTPRFTFLYAAAKNLFDISGLFALNRLDQPQKFQVMTQEAVSALQSIPQTDDAKSLIKKIQAAQKRAAAR